MAFDSLAASAKLKLNGRDNGARLNSSINKVAGVLRQRDPQGRWQAHNTAVVWFLSLNSKAVCDNSESKDPRLCLKRICSVTCVTRLSVQIASGVYSREVPLITLTSKPQELVITGQRGEITLQTAN
ncbi:hypothetical protein E1301_Tti016473 [Triplophysa tibetana]|uniref:Uncharacterized protein n=1 Tax=Triplophysa tibetana TaxID=1572043 RepID=A0A5A9P0A6_9TELE|nr:hypothetical protein E1301_Tti016473 [Triplophysa tibetana]